MLVSPVVGGLLGQGIATGGLIQGTAVPNTVVTLNPYGTTLIADDATPVLNPYNTIVIADDTAIVTNPYNTIVVPDGSQ